MRHEISNRNITKLMKFVGLQKKILLFMFTLGIIQGSYTCFSTNNLTKSKKSISIQSSELHPNSIFDFVEENMDGDADDEHLLPDLLTTTKNNFTFQTIQKKTLLLHNYLSLQSFGNQKTNILNCTFMI